MSMSSPVVGSCLVALWLVGACESSGGDAGDAVNSSPGPLGAACRDNADCVSDVCLKSEYGTPFCTRPCSPPWEACVAGDDVGEGEALCLSFRELPNPATGSFRGDMTDFCVPRCARGSDCAAISDDWEVCDVPKYLGDPLSPQLGAVKVCQSPSFQGKEPVDPAVCDYEKTVPPRYANERNLCVSYCDYLERCKHLPAFADLRCCEWGCFNQILIEGEVQDAWSDTIKCYIDTHGAFPETGPVNACTEPPKQCSGDPSDPTPPAARE